MTVVVVVYRYEDGTPATRSQMAKDVTTFLDWASNPEQDLRKRMGITFVGGLTLAFLFTAYYKRFFWGPIKTQKVYYTKK